MKIEIAIKITSLLQKHQKLYLKKPLMRKIMKTNKLIFLMIFMLKLNLAICQILSPYGTGFSLGSKEDLEIRLAWAKKDPCFKHGFAPESLEAVEIKKFWIIKLGPNSATPKCIKDKNK